MIDIKDQLALLQHLGDSLKKDVHAYAIGGTAMMFHGLKLATKDIDLVLRTEPERKALIKALEKLDYRSMDSTPVYFHKKNHPLMFKRGEEERIDLFLQDIISFTFSTPMQERARETHRFGRLIVHLADPQDIIILKCATDRVKDQEDAGSIITNTKVDYDLLVKEAQEQERLGHHQAVFELGCFLETLQGTGLPIPDKTLQELYGLLETRTKK